ARFRSPRLRRAAEVNTAPPLLPPVDHDSIMSNRVWERSGWRGACQGGLRVLEVAWVRGFARRTAGAPTVCERRLPVFALPHPTAAALQATRAGGLADASAPSAPQRRTN